MTNTAATAIIDEPALVQGNNQSAPSQVVFINAPNGDLVDIEYYCHEHMLHMPMLPWPCFDFGTDSNVYCHKCGVLINYVE